MRGLLATFAARALSSALALLPLRTAQGLGALFGALVWRTGAGVAQVTRANLKACFPQLEDAALAQWGNDSLRQTGRLIAELGMVWRWRESAWSAAISRVVGAERLEQARLAGRGVLLLVPHIGNWELLNLFLGRRYGLIAMYSPSRIAPLNALILHSRSRSGSTMVSASTAGIRALRRGLDEGRVVAVLPDQVPDRAAGIHAPFFGLPALTMTLPQRLARRTKAKVLLASALRLDDGTFAISFDEPGEGLTGDEPVVAATALNGAIEALVRRCPSQYLWTYKRFKDPPRGAQRLY